MTDTITALETQLASATNDRQKVKYHLLLAQAYKQAGNFEQALNHYEQSGFLKVEGFERLVKECAEKLQIENAEREDAESKWKRLLASEQEQRLLAETLQEVTIALTAQTNVAAVLDEILRQVQRLVPYNTANIMLLEDDMLRTVRWQGYEAFDSERFMSTLTQPLADFPLDLQAIQSRTPLILHNTHQEPLWVVLDKTAWIKSNMVIPICLREHVLGVLRLDADKVSNFSERDIERLMPLVNAAAIALENARLYERAQKELSERAQAEAQLKQSYRELMALNAIATAISQSRNLKETLTAILDKVLDVVFVENNFEAGSSFTPEQLAGCIYLLDEDKKNLSLVVQRGLPEAVIEALKTVQMNTQQSRVPVWDNPALSEEQINLVPEDFHNYLSVQIGGLEAALKMGWQFLVNVPLQFEDKMLGLLSIFSRNPSDSFASVTVYTPHPAGKLVLRQLQLLRAIGQQVGVAIENERLTREAAEIKVLQEVSQLRSELIANISHELRTPLGLIKATGTTLLAQDVEFDRQTAQMLLQGLDEETDKLEHLVDNLLDLSRIEQKGVYLHFTLTNIEQLVKKILEPMQTQNTKHHFVYHFPPDPLIINIDARRIEQVLRNLLSNAVKYSPDGGTITITGQNKNHQLLIAVSDQGIGISATDLPKIFERFYRVENRTTMSVRGIGLGLAISRAIVKAHGGYIWAESNPGTGSTFYVSLPL